MEIASIKTGEKIVKKYGDGIDQSKEDIEFLMNEYEDKLEGRGAHLDKYFVLVRRGVKYKARLDRRRRRSTNLRRISTNTKNRLQSTMRISASTNERSQSVKRLSTGCMRRSRLSTCSQWILLRRDSSGSTSVWYRRYGSSIHFLGS